jgi:hypothetical protein
MSNEYTPQERLSASIIASLIYPDWPSGPDLERDVSACGVYARAIEMVREPYHTATILMEKTGKLYDSPGDAATAWEGLRNMSLPQAPYARIDPLIREYGGQIAEQLDKEQSKANGKAPAEPKKAREYVLHPDTTESALLLEQLRLAGYTFRLNLCADIIEINGRPLDEITMAEIRVKLRDLGLAKKLKAAEDAYYGEAKRNSYHPVRDYLEALKWDNGDYIGELTGCLESSDPPIVYHDGTSMPLHHVYFYRWLIGAVAKAYTGAQNAMLVLDGPQGIGKSTLAHWLCPLPGFFIEGAINTQDKDNDIRLLTNWIWEVSELDATTRKADQSAIKSFITKEVVTVRKSFGRNDIKKPAMASLVGTLNNTSGFLADESGSRRFLITKIDRIDLAYQKIDCAQLWAQSRALYLAGHKWQLISEESKAQQKQNDRYEVSSVLEDYIDKYFIFDRSYEEPLTIGDIVEKLSSHSIRLSGSERSQAMEIARILTRRGARKIHTKDGNQWIGIGIEQTDG